MVLACDRITNHKMTRINEKRRKIRCINQTTIPIPCDSRHSLKSLESTLVFFSFQPREKFEVQVLGPVKLVVGGYTNEIFPSYNFKGYQLELTTASCWLPGWFAVDYTEPSLASTFLFFSFTPFIFNESFRAELTPVTGHRHFCSSQDDGESRVASTVEDVDPRSRPSVVIFSK